MENDNRLLTSSLSVDDEFDPSLRPTKLSDFIGQAKIVENLNVFIKSALLRKQPLDHVLLAGPPGLGKTTLSFIIANELGVNIKATAAPSIEKPGDLVSMLTTLEPNDVLFIDEIHRLSAAYEEILYPAMEDRKVDIMIGQGLATQSIKLDIAPFTLIGATTRTGLLTSALRDRFGIPIRMQYYEPNDLQKIALRSAKIMGYPLSDIAAMEIANRSRRTPRIVNRLLKRVADFATVKGQSKIDIDITRYALQQLDIDDIGLDEMDRRILNIIIDHYHGGPVGVKTIAISIGEEPDTIEDFYEPYLVQMGLLKRTPRGRMVTEAAYRHLGINDKYSQTDAQQQTIFKDE